MKCPFFIWALTFLILSVHVHAQWLARHGLNSNDFKSILGDLRSKGYRLTWLSGYTINDDPRFACIFEKKSTPTWVSGHGMSYPEYISNSNMYKAQGYRLVLVNGYTVKGVDYYVAIWDKSPSGLWATNQRITSTEYLSRSNQLAKAGYRLKHISGYAVGNQPRYAAIWEKISGPPMVTKHMMTLLDYESSLATYSGQGYRLVLVNGYQVNNVDYYAAIWDKSSSGPQVERHGMTSPKYQDEFDNLYYQGYQLRMVSGYDQGQSDRYAAIWENHSMKGSDLATIDNDINGYMKKNNVPGLSLAITVDDRLVFAKGFGYADIAAQRIVTPYSVFRIMSISKSITSTAIMKLVEQGRFKLSDKVFGPGSLTGDKYGNLVLIVNGKRMYNPGITDITVQMLLEHQAGWGGNADPEGDLITMTPAQAVSKIVATVPLAYTPNTSQIYSNFGFLILGRLVADYGGTGDYESYVIKRILTPSGVKAMSLASDSGPLPREVTYYPLGITGGFRIHEFDSFGGWVGSPSDLLRWSVHVDGIPTKPDFLSSTTEQVMWKASSHSATYAKGWIVNMPWRGHNGAFGGTGSYFTQRVDASKIGFAVVMNRNVVGDEFSANLRDLVDAMISSVSAWPNYDLF